MDLLEKSLKTSFTGAANQLTQLYMGALQAQKKAYIFGYHSCLVDVLAALSRAGFGNGATVEKATVMAVDALLEYLRSKERDYAEQLREAGDSRSEEQRNNHDISPLSFTSHSSNTTQQQPPQSPQFAQKNNKPPTASFVPNTPIPPSTNTEQPFSFASGSISRGNTGNNHSVSNIGSNTSTTHSFNFSNITPSTPLSPPLLNSSPFTFSANQNRTNTPLTSRQTNTNTNVLNPLTGNNTNSSLTPPIHSTNILPVQNLHPFDHGKRQASLIFGSSFEVDMWTDHLKRVKMDQ
eukprot:TRINITY_DN1573_c0_g1_i5.p1 TRINITY_DN1573_c0_g1~~TRINITY_DN1573_c0_g1_i5.p1  ORF type:complete len:293 (-),score=74.36 TRINITY_DN1573_c0_g1_i5:272-1150(-)